MTRFPFILMLNNIPSDIDKDIDIVMSIPYLGYCRSPFLYDQLVEIYFFPLVVLWLPNYSQSL